MKKIIKTIPLFLLAFTLLCTHQANAKVAPYFCNTEVGNSCVGACSPVGEINYTVSAPCTGLNVNLCVKTKSSNLCASHIARANVYVNGVLTASGDITAAGSTISFNAPCGSNVRVLAKLKHVNPHIHCVTFGEVQFALLRA